MREIVKVRHWGGLHDEQAGANLVAGHILLLAEALKEGPWPDLRINCSCGAGGDCLHCRNLVLDHDGHFIPGRDLVKILDANWSRLK
jgi:hypothetical protein